MTILAGDIKIVASKVMADVPEGGGGPTSKVLQDGVSNAIFPDISELDRAIGRVNMRQIHLHVQTMNVDTYMGANFIIAEPPADPRVTITAFQTPSLFDIRNTARLRMESYLALGPSYAGYLFGNMLQSQMTATILQREGVPLPVNGATLVLRKSAGTGSEFTQMVRITNSTSELRTFEDGAGPFTRRVVRLQLSDPLQQDFPGFDAARADPSFAQQAARTAVYETVVADAARYYGVKKLVEPITMGDLVLEADGIYTALVPSAQVETPITDSRTNQVSAGYVASGGGVSQTVNGFWNTTQSLFLGGAILPGSATFAVGGVALNERGGVLYQGTAQVGQLDLENGIATLATNVFGMGSLSITANYTPAAVPTFVSQSFAFPITIENRSLSYVMSLDPPPARGSLMISYMVAGKWYVLRDDGTGAIRGSDATFGIGNLNFTTGTLSLTLGALPDVRSALLFQFMDDVAVTQYPAAELLLGARVHFPLTTTKPIKPGSLTISWNDGTPKSVTDDGTGGMTGAGSGMVRYDGRAIALSPTVLPGEGTVFTLNYETITTDYGPFTAALADGGSTFTFTLAGSNTVGRLNFAVTLDIPFRLVNGVLEYRRILASVKDNGLGVLDLLREGEPDAWSVWHPNFGTIDYLTGVVQINKTANALTKIDSYVTSTVASGVTALRLQSSSYTDQVVAVIPEVGVTGNAVVASGYVVADAETITPTSVVLRTKALPGQLSGVRFTFDTDRFTSSLQSADLVKNPSPATGVGTTAGSIDAAGVVSINTWRTGAAPTITDWRGVFAPPVVGLNSPFLASKVAFRTAAAPVRSQSLQVSGTYRTGGSFTATANSAGVITGSHLSGTIDYEMGLVLLSFDAGYEVLPETLRYSAVTYQYVPLDASIIGMNPVSLPTDGRVPVFRSGNVIVIGNTQTTAAATGTNGLVVNTGRTRLSRAEVVGADGLTIHTGYEFDLNAGTVTYLDVTGWAQPVRVRHRIEDMLLAADVQINGTMRVTRQITHNYPTEGTYVSSAILFGDLFSRVSIFFSQATWNGTTWADSVQGATTVGRYNDTLAPIELTNLGTITERWAIQFTSATNFNLIGEHVGQIASGTIGIDFAPVNPETGVPYFKMKAIGWGSGWAAGNIVRHNTVGAMGTPWLVRTIQQGPETGTSHQFSVLARGDVDRPA